MCACGNDDGSNQECERCRLISELSDFNKHVAAAKDSIARGLEHSSMMRDAYANANGDLDKTAQWHYWMGRMQAQNEILVQWIDPEMADCDYCGKKCRIYTMYRPRELITDDLVCSESCAEAFNDRHVEP